MNKTKTILLFSIIFLVGLTLRVWNFPGIPYGYHQDELNAGYEAWSLLHYGTDRWGNSWPVYFPSWGSGQNVLYSYILIPFMAIFGDSDVIIRVPMLIAGILLPAVVYLLTKKWFGNVAGLVAMGLTAIYPELIRSSRWAVESNLVPFMVAVSLLVLTIALQKHNPKWWHIVFSLMPLAFLPYAYLITILPVGLLLVIMLFWRRKQIFLHKKWWLVAVSLFTLILLPLILYIAKITVFRNTPFFFEPWSPLSFPILEESRYTQIVSSSDGGIFDLMVNNLTQLMSGYMLGQMGGGENASTVPLFFVVLALVLPFIPKLKTIFSFSLVHLFVLTSLPLLFFVPMNNVRVNLFYVPSLILISQLIVYTAQKALTYRWVLPSVITAGAIYIAYVLIWWYPTYLNTPDEYYYQDLHQAIETVEKINVEKLPVNLPDGGNQLPLSYMQVMWYNKISPTTVAEYSNPEYLLTNYDFNTYKKPTIATPYYQIIRKNYWAPCPQNTPIYSGDSWEVYECTAKEN